MKILQNATQAMECGIEDYSNGSDARLKSAIRNVHAGILLMFKEKLKLQTTACSSFPYVAP